MEATPGTVILKVMSIPELGHRWEAQGLRVLKPVSDTDWVILDKQPSTWNPPSFALVNVAVDPSGSSEQRPELWAWQSSWLM